MQFIRRLCVAHRFKGRGEKSESEWAGTRAALGSQEQECCINQLEEGMTVVVHQFQLFVFKVLGERTHLS